MKRTIVTVCASALVAAPVSAGLVSISGGGIIYEDPDPDFPLPNQVQSNVVQGIDELQDLILGDDLSIDDLENLIGVVNLSAGDAVSSHLLAFDPAGLFSVSGVRIEFEHEVLAVITRDGTLANTHALFGREGLNYPGNVNNYGFEAGDENFSVDGNAVTFSGTASTPGDYFRVLTAIPAPGTGVVALAGLAAVNRRRRG